MKRFSLPRTLVAALTLLAFFAGQETWALAGVTGNIAGTIKDTNGTPVAGAQVQAVSPSQSKSATTDAAGHFIILALAPDTYTINLTKAGFQTASYPGVVVFADQSQQVAYNMSKALVTIGRVTAQSGSSLVKSGVGSDLYSVNAAQAAAAASLGGGGNLNNAYSALASVPGVQTSQGGLGWNFNATYVRGQNQYYTGYEYDGIPVNRAFDNYNSSTESSLGLSELQVYTGGGPASVASAGTSGFINQVIKTGSFPGFASVNLGIGTPTFYHQAAVEVGGSTPDRTFSYYVGLLGYNQDYRFFDNSNGAGYMTPGGILSGNNLGAGIGYGEFTPQIFAIGAQCLSSTCQGVKPVCPLAGSTAGFPAQGCWPFYSGISGSPSQISDREDVINLHMGIPKANGLRDDLQVLWSGSALVNYFYDSPDAIGPGNNQFVQSLFGTTASGPANCGPLQVGPGLTVNGCANNGQYGGTNPCYPNCGQIDSLLAFGSPGVCKPGSSANQSGCSYTYFPYADNVAYNVPFGTPIAKSASSVKAPGVYMAPDTPSHSFGAPIPANDGNLNNIQNDTGVTKLQYTYALNQNAYLRAYGYSFYSDWLQNGPAFGSADEFVPSPSAAQYTLITHTAGGALSFQDQINDQNLIGIDGNYTTASVNRLNNTSAYLGCAPAQIFQPNLCSPIGYMAKTSNGYRCFDPTSGKPVPCLATNGGYCVVSGSQCTTQQATWTTVAASGPTAFAPKGTAAERAGATWDSLWQGNQTGSLNTVKPEFTNASISDQFRPSDRFLINAAMRYDNFAYQMPNAAGPADAFYANMTANYTCVLAGTNEVLTQPLAAGAPPPASAQYVVGDCDKAATALHPSGPHTGWVHPNGTTQDGVAAPSFTASSPSSYSLNYWQPRFSMTYTQSPDVVWRLSAGRFTQPPISASVQYLSPSGDDRSVWENTMNLGFYSPFHPIPGVSSGQYDLSYEQHFRGTDLSMKITPFYTWVSGWQQQTFIGAGFVTQVPVGVNRNQGVEFQFNKGDFTRNGLSGQLAFTYTNSKVMFQNVPLSTGGTIPNTVIALNQVIAQYNALTKAGGGSPCYQAGQGVSCNTRNGKVSSGFDTILNPYYGKSPQGLLDPGAWYNPYSTAIAPNLNALLGSYISPIVSSLILNWRHDRLAITPSFTFQNGGFYGTPMDTNGLDPRTCTMNSGATGITKVSPHTNPLQCNYLTMNGLGSGQFAFLYIPDPQTGSFYFDNIQQPSSLVGNLQISYDVSPRIKLTILGASLFHACFGGSAEPWTAASPPSNVTCGYGPAGGAFNSTLYPSNFYNGTSINDFAANKARTPFTQSYTPANLNNGAIGAGVPPINVYFNAQVKI
jgi:hypothetical protein